MTKLALSDEILMKIDKPARYIGNELNSVGIFAEYYKKRRLLRENTFRCICPDIGWKLCNRTGGIATERYGWCYRADTFHTAINVKERTVRENGKYV